VPLLRIAQRATIIAIGNDSNLSSAEDAATYLSRHGVKPSILPVAGDDDYIPHILLDRAWKLRADFIVMGGFSHWRLTEHICRGTSHWLLEATHTPLFMAH
jgi:nucleotide-binding universal stress UspA family protein